MKIKKMVRGIALTGLAGIIGLTGVSSAQAMETKDEGYASYGYSLDETQRENTRRLLGAGEVLPEDEITMTPETYVSIFGGDVANIGNIYSSTYIDYQDEGHGVEVNIVTPDTILEVSEESYINAALTSGLKDATISVASTIDVSGTGALSGIYAIQQSRGEEVDPEVAQLTNDELELNGELEDEISADNPDATSDETDALTNGLLADIKSEIAKLAQDKDGNVEDSEARDIVINIVNNYGLNLSDETIQKLIDFATSFSKTEIALSPELQEQLEKLGGTLKEKGGDIWDGIKSTLNDTEVQESAGNLWQSITNFFSNLFSSFFNKN